MIIFSDFLSAADIYLQVSDYDPSPKSLNEAMNFELPIIATRMIGTCQDLVKENINGFQVNVTGGYDSPTDAFARTVLAGPMDISDVGSAYFDVDSYLANGWALTAKAVDTWGSGLTSVDYLQRDIQVRFTGEFDYDNPVTVGSGIYYPALDEGGSYCWIDGSRVGDFASHPDPDNPGTGSPFRIKVPFEVWDMEAEGGPQQIDIAIYDRMQGFASGDTVYAFNPYDRMYTHFIHLPYQEDGNYGEENSGWGAAYGDGVGEIFSFLKVLDCFALDDAVALFTLIGVCFLKYVSGTYPRFDLSFCSITSIHPSPSPPPSADITIIPFLTLNSPSSPASAWKS